MDKFLKRCIDLLLGMLLVMMLSPVFIIIALAIKFESPGPILFIQKRRGKDFIPFSMIKFRSLRHGAPDPCEKYETTGDDPRITRVGTFIRKTSLDELPQLFNVIAGTMSIVGPRPLVEWESQLSLPRYRDRYRVKPGITGLSQLNGRNTIGFDLRCTLDVEYVQKQRTLLDLYLIMKTPMILFKSREIYPTEKSRNTAAGR